MNLIKAAFSSHKRIETNASLNLMNRAETPKMRLCLHAYTHLEESRTESEKFSIPFPHFISLVSKSNMSVNY